LKRTETPREFNVDIPNNSKERIEATLQKLHILKERISELRASCEELQRLRTEEKSDAPRCNECGGPIEPGQEVEARNFGETARYYHKDCFRKLWLP
jgi:uncharacterized protein with PIN domain